MRWSSGWARGQKEPTTHFQTMWPASLSTKQRASELVASHTPEVTLPLIWACVFKVNEEALHLLSSVVRQTFFAFSCNILPPEETGRICEDLRLLGADIWLWLGQSIRWLSGIDRCAERPVSLCILCGVQARIVETVQVSAIKRYLSRVLFVRNILLLLCFSLLLCKLTLFFAPSVTFLFWQLRNF